MSASLRAVIVTARLRLRAFTPGDLQSLLAYRSDPEVARYQSWSANYTEAEGRAFISAVSSATLGGSGTWVNVAAELRTTGELIGDVALRVEADRSAGEVGFTFASNRQRCGYAREAVAALCNFALEEARLPRLFARTDARNTRAVRLLEATGFHDTGALTRSLYKGEMCDELCFERFPLAR